MPTREDIIKQRLIQYKPNEEERTVIRSALFNLITYASVGAAALGVSGRMWSKSRQAVGKKRTAIPAILGTFTGLAFGGLLGMSQGMQKVRQGLPRESPLLAIIMENEQLKQDELNKSLADIMTKNQDKE
ncbi:hypothetical protein BCR42DRAFT_403131 [Absidia repens]|uniref:Transmembrane protein n=1 Tax=Absidia repens TaxID=90262 RepID=A0A1X2IZ10_9FUNG|nr:hypothetical protein BCR42DRAFT_403131 [Absidia repens]